MLTLCVCYVHSCTLFSAKLFNSFLMFLTDSGLKTFKLNAGIVFCKVVYLQCKQLMWQVQFCYRSRMFGIIISDNATVL